MTSPLTLEVRGNIRRHLWDAIAELSDPDFQARTWDRVDNSHFTFVECCECFFDCMPDGVDAAMSVGLVSVEEARAIAPLWAAVDAYHSPTGNDYDNQAVLADPAWHNVVRIAINAKYSLLGLVAADEATRLAGQTGTPTSLRPEKPTRQWRVGRADWR